MGSSKPLLQARAASAEVIDLCSSDDDLPVPTKPISRPPVNPLVKSRPRSVTNPIPAPPPAVPSSADAAPDLQPDAPDAGQYDDFPDMGQDVDSLLDFMEDRPETPSVIVPPVDLFVPASAPLPVVPPKSDMQPGGSTSTEQNVPEVEPEQGIRMNVEPESPQRDLSMEEPSQTAAGSLFHMKPDEIRFASPEAMQIEETHSVEPSGQLSGEDPIVPPSAEQNAFVMRSNSSLFSSGNSSSSKHELIIAPTPEELNHPAPAVSENASASPTVLVNAVEAPPPDVIMASPPSTNLTVELPPPPSLLRPPRKSYTDSFFQRIMERNKRTAQENEANSSSQGSGSPIPNATPNKPVIPPPRRHSGSMPFASMSRSVSFRACLIFYEVSLIYLVGVGVFLSSVFLVSRQT